MPDCTIPNTTNTVPAEPILEPVEAEVEDLQLLTEEDIVEVQVVEAEGEELEAVSESLEAYLGLLNEAGSKGITHQSAAFLRVGLEHIDASIGYDKPALGLESFITCTMRDGLRTTVVSTEDIKGRIETVIKKVIEFIKRLIAKAIELWEKLVGPRTKTAEKAAGIKAAAKVFPAYPGGKLRGNLPPEVPEFLRRHAEKISKREESDNEAGKLTISNPAAVFAGFVNTYNNIDRELTYIKFMHETWAKAKVNILRRMKDRVRKEKGAEDIVYGALEEVHKEILNLVEQSVDDATIPGGIEIAWEEEQSEFVINDVPYAGPDSVQVDIRPTNEISKFADSIEKLLKSDPLSKKPHDEEFKKLAEEVTIALLENRTTGEQTNATLFALQKLVSKLQSAEVFARADAAVIKSLNAKLEIAMRELAMY